MRCVTAIEDIEALSIHTARKQYCVQIGLGWKPTDKVPYFSADHMGCQGAGRVILEGKLVPSRPNRNDQIGVIQHELVLLALIHSISKTAYLTI